jgi:hypothetical protein
MSDGGLAALFVDPWLVGDSPVLPLLTGSIKGSVELNWKYGDRPNVIEYSWQNAEGENGSGDNVRLEYVNGQPVFIRMTMDTETVRTWVLNTDRIKAELERRGQISSDSESQFVMSVVNATDFETVKWLFDPVDSTTAPNGYGYSINGKMFGDPTITAATVAELGQGFPDSMTDAGQPGGEPKKTRYLFMKVTHQLDVNGYFTLFEAKDVWSMSPLGVM